VLVDLIVEGTETVVVQLTGITASSPGVSIDLANDTATVNITDNDSALVSIAATTQAAEPATNGLFTVNPAQAPPIPWFLTLLPAPPPTAPTTR